MKPVTLLGHNCTGHGCFPSRASSQGEPRFTVKGIPVHLQGHSWVPHGCADCPPHGGALAAGAPRFTVLGLQLGRIGDPVSCGSSVAQGEPRFTVAD